MLGQPGRLEEWEAITGAVGSGLVEVECLRTLDRLRLAGALDEEELVLRREAVYQLTAEMEIVEPTTAVLRQASMPLPTALGTLDAIHLATAVLWREYRNEELVMATHDRALALAARSVGMRAVG
ncbi:MAG: PIN domain-containing protein [Gemmatimonadales bacterium]